MTFQQEMINKGAPLIERWTPYLEGTDEHPLRDGTPKLKDDWQRYTMARMLESVAANAVAEGVQTTSVFGTNYLPAVLAMVRSVFPNLMALDLVHTQPLDRPSGRVFYLDTKRGDGTYPGFQADPTADSRSVNQLGSQWTSYKDWASNTENGLISTDMSLSITQKDISVSSMKMKYQYTPELQQDLMAYHGVDANAFLQDAAIQELARELDSRIIAQIRSAIPAGNVTTYGTQIPSGYQFKEWKAELFRAVLIASANISRRRGQDPTWLICGTDALVELRAAEMIDSSGSVPVVNGAGIQRVGTLNGLMDVMYVPYLPSNEIIMGRKGTDFSDAGLIFLPYVLLFLGEKIFDPNYQFWTRSFMSRYALYTASQYLFSKVVVDPTTSGIS